MNDISGVPGSGRHPDARTAPEPASPEDGLPEIRDIRRFDVRKTSGIGPLPGIFRLDLNFRQEHI